MSGSPEPVSELQARPARVGPRVRLLVRVVRRPAGLAGLAITLVVVLTAFLADTVAPSDPQRAIARELLPPSWAHPMGTTGLGHDLFSAVVHGMRTSMTVVLWVTVISSVIGVAVGAVAGYVGGLVDDVAMRVAELVQTVPRFFLALMVLALFGPEVRNLVVLLGLTSWPLLARVVRAEALSVRRSGFVEAAQSLGARPSRILAHHVVPNVLPAANVVIALTASRVIVLEATLRFLGLGDPSAVSLGSLARDSQAYLEIAWWVAAFPGLAIATAALGLNLLADAVNEALDPVVSGSRKWRRRGRTRAVAEGRERG